MKKTVLLSILILGQIFRVNGQSDTINIKNIVYEWSEALSNHDLDKLGKLYDAKLLFYCKELSKDECIKIKSDALRKVPDFKQKVVSNIELTSFDSGIIKCDFTKEVSFKNSTKNYPSYLLVKKESGRYIIVGESDKITDASLNFHLSIGQQINISNASSIISSDNNQYLYYILIGGVAILGLFLLIYFIKKKSKNKISKNESVIENTIEPVYENPAENISIDKIENITESKKEYKTKEYLSQSLTQTKTAITKLFDTADSIDRMLYGKRMKFFILGCFLVLVIAPLLDLFIDKSEDLFTFFSTFAFFLFILVLFLSYISSWRDDSGNWSFKRAKSKLQTFFESLKDTVETTKTNSQDETLYKLGQFFFFGGVGWKTLHNVSIFIRKPIEHLFNSKIESLRQFEKFTHHYYWIPILLGLVIIIYLYNKNPQILQRIKNELRQLFGMKLSENSKYSTEIVKIVNNPNTEFIINSKAEQQINTAIASSNSKLFNDFAVAIKNWSPRGAYFEYEFQDRLERHLIKQLPDATIKTEFPIGDKSLGNKGRADIVINDTILIEMKRGGISAGEIRRAKGQISDYSIIWQNKGPVILLLCNYDYEHAKLAFASTMADLARLDRPVLTIVAATKTIE